MVARPPGRRVVGRGVGRVVHRGPVLPPGPGVRAARRSGRLHGHHRITGGFHPRASRSTSDPGRAHSRRAPGDAGGHRVHRGVVERARGDQSRHRVRAAPSPERARPVATRRSRRATLALRRDPGDSGFCHSLLGAPYRESWQAARVRDSEPGLRGAGEIHAADGRARASALGPHRCRQRSARQQARAACPDRSQQGRGAGRERVRRGQHPAHSSRGCGRDEVPTRQRALQCDRTAGARRSRHPPADREALRSRPQRGAGATRERGRGGRRRWAKQPESLQTGAVR